MSEQDKQLQNFGAIAGIVIVVIMLLVGAVYFFSQRIQKQQQFQTIQAAQNQSASSSDNFGGVQNDATVLDFNGQNSNSTTLK